MGHPHQSDGILPLPVLQDNVIWIWVRGRRAVVVDPAVAGAVIDWLNTRGLELTAILQTHHHADHIDGLDNILEKHNAVTIGAQADIHRLPKLDEYVEPGDQFLFQGQTSKVFDVSGHTVGHIALYISTQNILFSGDSLMALGCGRLFEGSAEQMWHSLSNLLVLPDKTRICSGHEYTENNASFALTVDPNLSLIHI